MVTSILTQDHGKGNNAVGISEGTDTLIHTTLKKFGVSLNEKLFLSHCFSPRVLLSQMLYVLIVILLYSLKISL